MTAARAAMAARAGKPIHIPLSSVTIQTCPTWKTLSPAASVRHRTPAPSAPVHVASCPLAV